VYSIAVIFKVVFFVVNFLKGVSKDDDNFDKCAMVKIATVIPLALPILLRIPGANVPD
jgi:hypothetical protein